MRGRPQGIRSPLDAVRVAVRGSMGPEREPAAGCSVSASGRYIRELGDYCTTQTEGGLMMANMTSSPDI